MARLEHLIRERLYHLRRKNQRKQKNGFYVHPIKKTSSKKKAPYFYSFYIKKLLGLALILIACLLLLNKCFNDTSLSQPDAEVSMGTTAKAASLFDTETYLKETLKKPIHPYATKKILKYAKKYQISFADALSFYQIYAVQNRPEKEIYRNLKSFYYNPLDETLADQLTILSDLYKQFIYDIKVFPIDKDTFYQYENSWGAKRTYPEERSHYGTDIMGIEVESGQVPIYSMTSGTVEKIGWNTLGGYRVGIRSEGGSYFYYAHLHDRPMHLNQGDLILAGDFIGYMGDTGYGKEGTRGQFPVHLHLGIAVNYKEDKEVWINPFYILQYLEQ